MLEDFIFLNTKKFLQLLDVCVLVIETDNENTFLKKYFFSVLKYKNLKCIVP